MSNNQPARSKITWQTILFILLMLPPFLGVFNKPVGVNGIPLLFLYIFLTWLLFIIFTAVQARKTDN